jgi:hypothetical protein
VQETAGIVPEIRLSLSFHTFSNSLMILQFNAAYSCLVIALLTFKRPAFTYANALKKPPKIHFMYFDNKEIYSIFKTCWIISVLFSTKCHLFHNLMFFC